MFENQEQSLAPEGRTAQPEGDILVPSDMIIEDSLTYYWQRA
jgi:hypothetical protein